MTTDPQSPPRDRLFALIASIPGSGTFDWCSPARALLDEIAAAVPVSVPPAADRAADRGRWTADGRLKPHAIPAATTPDQSSMTGGFDDSIDTTDAQQAADRAALSAQLWTLAAMLDQLHTLIATSSRDWQTYRVDAWLWAVLCGWDCEQAVHDETCTHGALEETAAMHGWDDDTVAKARRYRAVVHAITAPAVVAQPAKEARPPVGYSGKGRLWCLSCPRPDGEDAPMTVDLVCVGELCPGCGRDVIDAARSLDEQQPKEA